MKLFLCPANQVFKDMALSAMDYYYETNIISIAGTGQSAFGDNYFDIPTTQIDVVIDDDEYAQIVASDRDHTLGKWWSLGATITDDNDVRLFIGLIRNDSLKHDPTLNTFGFEVLDLLASCIANYESSSRSFVQTYYKYERDGDTSSQPLTYFYYDQNDENISESIGSNIYKMVNSLQSTIGSMSMSGVVLSSYGITPPPICLSSDGIITESDTNLPTVIDFPHYKDGSPFNEWSDSFKNNNHDLKCVDRFIDTGRVRYPIGLLGNEMSITLLTCVEVRIYRRSSESGYATIHVSQYDHYCPIVCLGSARIKIDFSRTEFSSDSAISWASAMADLREKLRYYVSLDNDSQFAVITSGLASDNNDDVIYSGIKGIYTDNESNWETVYTIPRIYMSTIDTYHPNTSYMAIPSFSTTTSPTITYYGKCDPVSSFKFSSNYSDVPKNLKDITIMSNTTIQSKNNIISVKNKIDINNLEIDADEEVTALDDDMISNIGINGHYIDYRGVDFAGDFMFYNTVYTSEADTKNAIASALDKSYIAIFEAYNVLMLADLIGYYEFTPGQAISYNGKYYRVFAWEYDEENGVTSIDAYGRK